MGGLGLPHLPDGSAVAGGAAVTALLFGDPHAGHELVNLTAHHRPGGAVGRRVCLDCDVVIGPLVLCGETYTRSWSHGEGAGATNTPRAGRGRS